MRITMPSPLRSSASIKTESAYGDETADEVEVGEYLDGNEQPEPDESVVVATAAEGAGDSEPDDDDDLALVASDLVPPEATARQSTTTSQDTRDARESSKVTGAAAPRCEICKKQKQRVNNQLIYLPFSE